jgi:hypothetical protein
MNESAVGTALLEIVELANGDIVLQRVGAEGAPLVRIRFSAESRGYLSGSRLGVARAMIEAGIRAAAQQSGGEADVDYVAGRSDSGPVIH